jgi:hypothetical protein
MKQTVDDAFGIDASPGFGGVSVIANTRHSSFHFPPTVFSIEHTLSNHRISINIYWKMGIMNEPLKVSHER